MAKALTFWSDEPDDIEVEIIGRIGETKTFKVRYRDREIARHVDRLKPLDDEARGMLGKK
jgi:hypothetical protein